MCSLLLLPGKVRLNMIPFQHSCTATCYCILCSRSSPVRHCSNNRCCPGCWGPRKVPGSPSSRLEAADPASVEMETRTAPPGHRCRGVNAGKPSSDTYFTNVATTEWNGNASFQRNRSVWCRTVPWPKQNQNCRGNPPGFGLRRFIHFGLIGLRFREVKGPFGFLLLEELEGQLTPLDGAPEGRNDIFTLQTRHFPPRRRRRFRFFLKAMQQHTLLERKGKRFVHVRRRQLTLKWKLLRAGSMQLEN